MTRMGDIMLFIAGRYMLYEPKPLCNPVPRHD